MLIRLPYVIIFTSGREALCSQPSRWSLKMAFTEAQLTAAFDKVANPADWRDSIWAVVDRDAVEVTVHAIQHFTAASVEVKDLEWNDEFMISSAGYRMGPAGC